VKKLPFISSKIVKKNLIKHKKVVYLKMQHIQGNQRHQLQMSSLDDKIGTENQLHEVSMKKRDCSSIPDSYRG